MSEKIEEFLRHLVRLGFLLPGQLEDLLRARRGGDTREYGQIALDRKYMGENSVKRLLVYLERTSRTLVPEGDTAFR